MAATRLIAMHVNKGKSIGQCLKDRTDYAKNGEKTQNGQYISAYACDPETVDQEFLLSKKEYLRITGRQIPGDIIAYQIRQSFKPGEVSAEEANKIGYETAMRFTHGEHAFIVATHTDRAHIHNHIIFNSTNLSCDRKFKDSWFIALALQKLSDQICLEHCLSVIKPRKPGERDNALLYHRVSFRHILKGNIDAILASKPENFEVFLEALKDAEADPHYLQNWFGKIGLMLSVFARGEEQTPVNDLGVEAPVKSVGNSTTTPQDLVNDEDVRLVLYLLAESVSERLRKNHFEGQVVSVYVRNTDLWGFHQQKKVSAPTNISGEIEEAAFDIFQKLYRWEKPIRSIGISVGDLKPEGQPRQLSLFLNEQYRERQMRADRMVTLIRSRYGYAAVQRGIMHEDWYLSSLNATAEDHMIHPHSYLEHGNRSGCEAALCAEGR